jgi:hypothetical protein
MRHVRQYWFLDVNLAVSGTKAVLDAMHARLRYFPDAAGSPPDLRFEFVTKAHGARHHVARPTGQSWQLSPVVDGSFGVEYFPAEDRLYASYGEGARALCDIANGVVQISIGPPEAEHLWLATHPTFVVPLFEMLKRRGYFNIHAAAVSIGGRGLLFAGHTTAGKSTLAVALCRTGVGFVSDDYVFLTERHDGLKVLGFPEELDLLDGTIRLFPELRGVLDVAKRPGWSKRQIRVEEHWDVPQISECVPAVLMFPAVADTAVSTIEPIGVQEAIAELVPNVQCTQPASAQAHLDLLGALVRQCACYRLRTGRDLDVLPGRLRELVEARRLEEPVVSMSVAGTA